VGLTGALKPEKGEDGFIKPQKGIQIAFFIRETRMAFAAAAETLAHLNPDALLPRPRKWKGFDGKDLRRNGLPPVGGTLNDRLPQKYCVGCRPKQRVDFAQLAAWAGNVVGRSDGLFPHATRSADQAARERFSVRAVFLLSVVFS